MGMETECDGTAYVLAGNNARGIKPVLVRRQYLRVISSSKRRKRPRYYGGLVEPDEPLASTISGNACRHLILGRDSFVCSRNLLFAGYVYSYKS